MRVLNTIRLTNNQKRVIARIAAAPTAKVASEKISSDQNIITARNELMKLGLITFNPSQATITNKGQLIAQQENILDDTGQLTPEGEKFAYSSPQESPEENKTAFEENPKFESYTPGKILKELFNL